MPVFYILIGLVLIVLWVSLFDLFIPIGKYANALFREIANDMKKDKRE